MGCAIGYAVIESRCCLSALEQFQKKVVEVEKDLQSDLKAIKDLKSLEDFRVGTFGKKGRLTQFGPLLGALSHEDKPAAGKAINELKARVQKQFDQQKVKLEAGAWQERLEKEKIDLSLPAMPMKESCEHPVALVEAEIVDILERCGFLVEVGPEVEHEFYNFSALNIPENHPARDLQDTFYIKNKKDVVLRTHTSPVQVRTMQKQKPPIRMICPGRVYRSDYDATHSPMFHQIEGLFIDEDVHMGDLKGILECLMSEFFAADLAIRLRPSFFPFTEPSAEVDLECCFCHGKGCRVCKQSGWIEIAGCGMVDPEVLKNVDIDPSTYQGFAFGFGLERMTMLKFGINDLRSFFESDHRFISQFARWRS